MQVAQRLEDWLDGSGRPWRRIEHGRITSAEQAALVRGTPLQIGGKTLVFKVRQSFALAVVPGDCRVDNRALRKALGAQRIRFASAGELAATIGLEPGSIPPFGEPIFPYPLLVDKTLASREAIAFTVARHTVSAVMSMEDYLALAKPQAVVSLVG